MLDEMMGGMLLPRTTDDGTARGQRALVVTAVLTGLSIVIVAMRMYARVGLMKLTGREDYMILISLVLSCTYLGLVAAEVHFGLGKHDADLSDVVVKEQLKSSVMKRLWAAIPFYNASLIFTKFSILFQYLRIFPDRRFRLACWIVFGIVATYGTWAVVSGFLNCVPVAKFWNRNISGYCLSFEAVWFFNASMNIATDTTLLILPMPLLSQLQLPRMQKFALMGVFAIGGLPHSISFLLLEFRLTNEPDSNVGAAYWTAAECNVAIICACLPFLRPIVSRIFPRFLSTNSYNRYTRNPTMTASRMTATRMTARSHRQKVELYSQDRDYGMYTIDVKSGEASHDSALDGIAVTTTTMIQETSRNNDESTSQRRLVVDV
ncbi:uncharacterized protein An01g02360 [Aspergillus niger]|uniref:Contig An01c0080, genomic contig n=2 Tax=Aspergillus niger TaxID=5061 RepID=A2Q7Y3_ASPNC|nr:uncharacterized protein An01g02360 [Aspergillus niger]CAK43606.1 unnamed protein product [Aspergillus niger]